MIGRSVFLYGLLQRLRSVLLLVSGMLLMGGSGAWAQELSAEPVSEPVAVAEEEELEPETGVGDVVTPREHELLKRYLPRSWKKLVRRDPYHILAVGDSITEVKTENLDQMPSLKSYYGTLAQELAHKFFYTGEIRDIDPREWEPAKFHNDMGPEITIQNVGLGGRYINHGMQKLWAESLTYGPDLVTINFGVNDSGVAVPVWEYIKHTRATVEFLHGRGIDVFLLGPSHNLAGDAFENLAMTRPYASALKDLAEELGVFCVDLGEAVWNSYEEGAIEGMGPEEALEETLLAAKEHYMSDEMVFDPLHPDAQGQALMGHHIFEQLFEVEPVPPVYELDAEFVTNAEMGGTLRLTVTNASEEPREGFVQPLKIFHSLEVARGPNRFELEPGESQVTEWQYTRAPRREGEFALRYDLLPAHENFHRVPVLLMDQKSSRLLTTKAVQKPLGVLWNLGRTDFVEGEFSVFALVSNPTDSPVKAAWKADWLDQEASGVLQLGPGEKKPLQITFEVQPNPGRPYLAGDMVVTFALDDGRVMRVKRGIELLKNLSLGERYYLSRWVKRADREELPPVKDFVEFEATANVEGLAFEFVLRNFDPYKAPGEPAIRISVGLDAQDSEHRARHGYMRNSTFGVPHEGTVVTVDSLRRAHFGLQYVDKMDSGLIQTAVSYPDANTRVVRLFFPRSLFKHHEWELGNRKSWLGFNLNVTKAAKGEHAFGVDEEQTWAKNGLSYPDPMGLGVLELTTQPSPYWRLIVE